MQTIDTIMGPICAPDWPDDLIVRALQEQGEWARIEQLLAASLVRPGDSLWDGGAFLGTFGIGVAQVAAEAGRGPAQILAIDPGLELRDCLKSNLAALAPCPTHLASCAIALENMTMAAADQEGSEANHGGIAYVQVTDAEGVPGRSLWDLRQEFGDYDFLKLDLEGGEYDALRSDFDHIAARKPVIWAECNESTGSIRVLEALVALGYEPEYLAFPSFRPVGHRPSGQPLYAMAYEAVLLATSPDRAIDLGASGVADQVIHRRVRSSWDLRQALWATPRWAMAEWTTMPRHELIGILGKVSRGMDLRDYLAED